MNVSAIVLCGGRSQRMGRDKASLPFGDATLLERVVAAVAGVADEVVVVGRASPTLSFARVMPDATEGLGPLGGLLTGLDAATRPHVLLVSCDLPLLVPGVLARLLELAGDADACVPRIAGRAMPTCAVYATRVAGIVRSRLQTDDRSLRGLLDTLRVRWVDADELRDVDPDLHSFLDCDTPDEYAAALARLRASSS